MRLLVLGAGGHARAVADVAAECGWDVAGFLERVGAPLSPGVIGDDGDIVVAARRERADACVVGVGNTALARRRELFDLIRSGGLQTPALVHPRASVSRSARVGAGSVVCAGVVLGPGVEVGENVVLYGNVTVEHGCRIDDHAYLAPGVILCGDVHIEAGVFLGAGAIVLPGVVMGKDAMLSAGGCARADVRAGARIAGNV